MIPRIRLGLRWKTTGKKRFQSIRQRASEQHVDYLRQLGAPPPRDPVMQNAADRARWRFDFAHLDRSDISQKILDCVEDLGASSVDALKETIPNPTEQAVREFLVAADLNTQEALYRRLQLALERKRLQAVLSPSYSSEPVNEVHFDGFGSIKVLHGDLLPRVLKKSNGFRPNSGLYKGNDALREEHRFSTPHLLLPMVPNLRPAWGLSLEVFNRGGTDFVKQTWEAKEAVEKVYAEQVKLKIGSGWNDPGDQGDPDVNFGLSFCVDGYTVDVKKADGTPEEPCEVPIRFFLMPMYFHGDDSDQKLLLRSAIKRALTASLNNAQTIHLPHVAVGYYGYDPQVSARVLVDEAIDALLQVDVSQGEELWSNERNIVFIDRDRENVELLSGALESVKRRYRPESQMQSAHEFWSQRTRQLIVLPDRPYQFLRQESVKFKKHHGIVRCSTETYRNNVRSMLWRAQKVRLPQQLLVKKESTIHNPEWADYQHPAQPYYFRGISHSLFPKSRTTFHTLRPSGAGWRGSNRQYRIREDTRPRL